MDLENKLFMKVVSIRGNFLKEKNMVWESFSISMVVYMTVILKTIRYAGLELLRINFMSLMAYGQRVICKGKALN